MDTVNKGLIPCIVIDPKVKPKRCIIWMHGLGADGHDFEPIVPQLNLPDGLGIRFIFPHAPVRSVTLNQNYPMPAWYDIVDLTPEGREDSEGLEDSNSSISDIIAEQVRQGIETSNIILAGFSQGAALALYTGLRYPEPLGGIIALSGYLPMSQSLKQEAHMANKNIPIHMTHGTMDPVINVEFGHSSAKLLDDLGYNVTWKTYPMEHSLCDEQIRSLSAWLIQGR